MLYSQGANIASNIGGVNVIEVDADRCIACGAWLGYNATYIVPEAVITLILICIPPMAKALEYVKRQAING